MKYSLIFVAAIGFSLVACAQESTPTADAKVVATVSPNLDAALTSKNISAEQAARIQVNLPDISAENMYETPIKGIVEIRSGQAIAYATEDGRYLIEGDMIDMQTGLLITEERRKIGRVERLSTLKAGDYIEFASDKVPTKDVVTVFTDIDCGYCRKLHNEIGQYNARGIAVRYLFYPRQGPGSAAFQKAEAVWCSADRNKAMTTAKQGGTVTAAKCTTPIMAQYQLGAELGLRGTPMMILPDGEVVSGYIPAPTLAARLQAPQPLMDGVGIN